MDMSVSILLQEIKSFLVNFNKDTNMEQRMFILKEPTVEAVGGYVLLNQRLKVPGEKFGMQVT